MTDIQLLREYAEKGSEEAFASVVERYMNLVYSAAVRQISDSTSAEEITQVVFIILARKANALHSNTVLSGWLLRTTRHVALNLRRREMHRKELEDEMQALHSPEEKEDAWKEIAPVLDKALFQLSEKDRDAVALRFFERKSFKEISEALRVSEDGAQKRVSRALEKLRKLLVRRGVVLSGGAISSAVFERSVHAAPEQFGAGFARAVALSLSKPSASVLEKVADAFREMRRIELRKVLFKAAIPLLIIPIIFLGVRNLAKGSAQVASRDNAGARREAALPASKVLQTSEAPTVLPAGALRFQVVDEQSGAAVPNALLTLVQIEDFPNRTTNTVTTDSSGAAFLPIHRTPVPHWDSRVEVFKNGYVPKYVSWSEYQQDEIEAIPSEYTVRISRGVKIAATVLDEMDSPVADARVVFGVTGPAPGASLDRERLTMMWGYHTEVTDSLGRWECDHVPAEFSRISYTVLHPNYVPVRFECVKIDSDSHEINRVTEESLKNGTAIMRVKSGLVVRGVAVDPSGNAVANVKVTNDRNWREPTASVVTGTDGRFEFRNAAANPTLLTFEAEGFAPAEVKVDPSQKSDGLKVQVSRGSILRGRVLDEGGAPVANAEIELVPDSSNRERFHWNAKSDANGSFEWRTAPEGPEHYQVEAAGFESLAKLELTPDGSEKLITLKAKNRTRQIIGTVVDAINKQPLESFEVYLGIVERDRNGGLSIPDPPPLALKGKAGVFALDIDADAPGYMIELKSRGYSGVRKVVSSNLTYQTSFTFELKPAAEIKGVVQLPGGKPASAATVVLCLEKENPFSDGDMFLISPRMSSPAFFDLNNTSLKHIRTDASGQFSFEPNVGGAMVAVAHDFGCAEVRVEQLASSRVVRLQPWGRIEGKLKIGNRAGTNELVYLTNWRWYFGEKPGIEIHLTARTDNEGGFVFEGVPPGECQLFHELGFRKGQAGDIPLCHGILVTVLPGQTARTTLGGTGRSVVGRIETPGPEPIDWSADVQSLMPKRPGGKPPQREQFTSDEGYRSALTEYIAIQKQFWTTAEGREHQKNIREYVLNIAPDGSFRIDDVVPGEYTLRINVTKRTDPNDWRSARKWLSLEREVTVGKESGGEDELDLGVLRLVNAK